MRYFSFSLVVYRICFVVTRTQAAGRTARLGPFHNLESVGGQVQKDSLCNLRAVLRRNPFIVQVRTAITLWVFDKRRMNGVGYHLLYRVGRHFAPLLFLVSRIIARNAASLSNTASRDYGFGAAPRPDNHPYAGRPESLIVHSSEEKFEAK